MHSEYSIMALVAFATLVPILVASGTCFIKFSIVFVLVRNALSIQQVPSNMTLNGISLFLALFVMLPVVQQGYDNYLKDNVNLYDVKSVVAFADTGLDGYKKYLMKYSDPDLVDFFEKAQANRLSEPSEARTKSDSMPSIIALLPAYSLSEIKSAFKIGFYLYLPFVLVDMVVSCVLLALGMMMMSPVSISTPIKLILFVAMDGWSLLSKGLVMQYIDLANS